MIFNWLIKKDIQKLTLTFIEKLLRMQGKGDNISNETKPFYDYSWHKQKGNENGRIG